MREYSREEKRELSKRYNNGEFELFSKEEKLALALWQVEKGEASWGCLT